MITIDGSQGEGGGQVLRTSLSLSLVTNQPFKITKIRAGRGKPGLLRQHLTSVEAAAQVGSATVEGAELGSQQLTFKPGRISPGEHSFAVGTAGSATLVFQTILPALMLGTKPSTLTLEGGTHNSFAPPFDFLAKTFLPVLERMGPKVTAELERPGFYPAGGGKFHVKIQPVDKLQPIELMDRGPVKSKSGRILVSHLPEEIGTRQARMLRNKLNWPKDAVELVKVRDSNGPGNVVMAEVACEAVTEIFTAFGARNVPSGKVVGQVVDEVREYLTADAPVGEHLADQLMIPLALAGSGQYRALKASLHARTNAGVINQFLPDRISISDTEGSECLVHC